MALHNTGITSLFPVQIGVWQETIGPGSFERDLCINSPTGSGKTLAYALPIIQMLSTRTINCLRALVVLPTRDLAVQVTCHYLFSTNSQYVDCLFFFFFLDNAMEFILTAHQMVLSN